MNILVDQLLLLFIPQSCPTLCDPMDCSTPGLPEPAMSSTNSQSPAKLMPLESVMPPNHLIL